VAFRNGWIATKNGDVFIYYGASDTRLNVVTSTVEKLLDDTMNTPAKPPAEFCVRGDEERADPEESGGAQGVRQSPPTAAYPGAFGKRVIRRKGHSERRGTQKFERNASRQVFALANRLRGRFLRERTVGIGWKQFVN
jgi:hypothetical protein